MAEFVLGMKAEADRLAALGIDVGEPLADEQPLYDTAGGLQIAAYQRSSKGLFWYDAGSNTVCFLVAAGL